MLEVYAVNLFEEFEAPYGSGAGRYLKFKSNSKEECYRFMVANKNKYKFEEGWELRLYDKETNTRYALDGNDLLVAWIN